MSQKRSKGYPSYSTLRDTFCARARGVARCRFFMNVTICFGRLNKWRGTAPFAEFGSHRLMLALTAAKA
jgi:hypothetical protein